MPLARISQQGGPKATKGTTFLNTILDVRSNRRAKHEMGGTDFKWGSRAPLALPLATALHLAINVAS